MITSLLSYFAVGCGGTPFFGVPTWYEYLHLTTDSAGRCIVNLHLVDSAGTLDLSALLLIGLAILDMLIRLASLIAVGFIIYAGLQYVTTQGEPDKAKQALGTIISALIGLGITIFAAAIVAFIGTRFGR